MISFYSTWQSTGYLFDSDMLNTDFEIASNKKGSKSFLSHLYL